MKELTEKYEREANVMYSNFLDSRELIMKGKDSSIRDHLLETDSKLQQLDQVSTNALAKHYKDYDKKLQEAFKEVIE